jgi:hypothetical protein
MKKVLIMDQALQNFRISLILEKLTNIAELKNNIIND